VNEVVGGGEVLLVLTDSNPSSPSQEFIHDTLRLGIGETRHEVDAPGYLISADELQKVVGLFTLMASFRWKCYLYCSREQLTLYNWEGSIFEIWTSSIECYRHILTILGNFHLREIADAGET
jgi:hypothetical protein